MNRSLKLSAWLALALGSSQACAGLGQIQLKSSLGQPLLAEIPVWADQPTDLRGLSVRLADSASSSGGKIHAGHTDIPLQITVVDASGGAKVIRITSSQPVDTPDLDLLLEVRSESGTKLQEYPLHLSSAAMAQASNAAARSPDTAGFATTTGRNFGPVRRGQTLSAIVRQSGLAGSFSQRLLAIKQANPTAFYRDNINALKAGAVLRIPRQTDIDALDRGAAGTEVRRQNLAWRQGRAAAATTVADAATRRGASSAPSADAGHGDQLELLPAAGRHGQSGAAGDLAAQQAEQSRLRESLAALQQQSDELQSRIKDLEDINSKNSRLLSLKDNEIAELQRKLGESAAAKPSGGVASAIPGAAASQAAPAQAASLASPEHAAAAVSSGSEASATSTQGATAATAGGPSTAAAPPWYRQAWLWIVGIVVLVAVFLLALVSRRKPALAVPAADSPAEQFNTGSIEPFPEGDREQDRLLDQLAEQPDNVGLHLELVSLYYHRRDVEHFEAAAEAMYAHIADPQQAEWLEVLRMGQDLVPGHPLFAAPVSPAAQQVDDEWEPGPGIAQTHHDDDFLPPPLPSAAVPPIFATAPVEREPAEPFPASPASEAGPGVAGTSDDSPAVPPAATLLTADHSPSADADPDGAHTHGFPLSAHAPGAADEPSLSWHFEAPQASSASGHAPAEAASRQLPSSPGEQATHALGGSLHEVADVAGGLGHFSDDPVDTKLDLARAYLDMEDADGARAMLEEVLAEGSQMQKDIATKLLAELG